MKLKKKWIKEPMYGGNFWFCIGNKNDLFKFMKKKKFDIPDRLKEVYVDGVCLEASNGCRILYINEENLSVLVHELMHLTQDRLMLLGISMTEETKEVYAYYYEYIFEECYKFLALKNLRRK